MFRLSPFVKYRVNTPKVIHQTFETEVVIVNLESGNYYSVGGSGIEIWRRLQEGQRIGEIVAGLGANGESSKVTAFVEVLKAEQLIVKDTAEVETTASRPERAPAPFVPPSLEKFTEMRDLLLLDPIHEMDEAGWPKLVPPRPDEK